jgi:hypothetical protein
MPYGNRLVKIRKEVGKPPSCIGFTSNIKATYPEAWDTEQTFEVSIQIPRNYRKQQPGKALSALPCCAILNPGNEKISCCTNDASSAGCSVLHFFLVLFIGCGCNNMHRMNYLSFVNYIKNGMRKLRNRNTKWL